MPSHPRRVLIHLSPNTYPPLPAQHHTARIWAELAKGFDEYHVLARSQTNQPSTTRQGNVVLHLLPRLTQKSKVYFFSSFYVLWLARRVRATHLLCQCPLMGGIAAVVAKALWDMPVMIELHGDVYFRYLRQGGLRYALPAWLTRVALGRASRIRSLSSTMTAELTEHGLAARAVLVPNRVSTRLFDQPKTRFDLGRPVTLLGIGRFVEQKGFDIAIEALRVLRTSIDARLVLVGGGPLRQRLEERACGLPVELVDWVEQSTLRDWMAQADIYLQPSKPFLGEAMPRTILEAMAMRLPIVSTRVAAIPGVLHDDVNALLVEPADTAALAAAVRRLLDDSALRQRLAAQAYADVLEHYEWDRVFEQYRAALLEMT